MQKCIISSCSLAAHYTEWGSLGEWQHLLQAFFSFLLLQNPLHSFAQPPPSPTLLLWVESCTIVRCALVVHNRVSVFIILYYNSCFKFLYSIFMSLSVNCETRYTSWCWSWSKSTSLENFHQLPIFKLELFSISCSYFKVKHAQHALWHFIDLTQFPFCKIQMFEVSWKAAAFKYSCIAIHGFRKGKKATKRQKGNQKVKRQQRGSESNL